MEVFIVRPEDGLFLKADGTWSEVREEAKAFPAALSARIFLESHNIKNAHVCTGDPPVRREKPAAVRKITPPSPRAGKTWRVRLVCDGNQGKARVVSLSHVPVPGQRVSRNEGHFDVTGIVAIRDEESNVTVYLRSRRAWREEEGREHNGDGEGTS